MAAETKTSTIGAEGARKLNALAGLVKRYSSPEFSVAHGGHVQMIAAGNYTVSGLSRHVRLGEFVAHRSPTGIHLGEVVRVEPDTVVVCPIEPGEPIGIHDTVIRKGAFRIAPTNAWCGRTINALGEPIDGRGPLVQGGARRSISNSAPPSMTRRRVEKGFQTGVRAIDIFAPLCLGQRLGIFAGSGVGKSTLLSMLARADAFDRVVIALVGERGREVREFIEDTLGDNLAKSVAVVATSDESPMLRKMAPLTAVTIAEHYRDQGENVLLIVDNHNDPIADSTRGILDGHIVLERSLAEEGRYPPVNPLSSISRLARKAWTPDQEKLVGRLKSLIHRYEETRDLRLIGGYRPGSDAERSAGRGRLRRPRGRAAQCSR